MDRSEFAKQNLIAFLAFALLARLLDEVEGRAS